MLDSIGAAIRRYGALALAIVAIVALGAVVLLSGCGGGGDDEERKDTQPVDCTREPEKCR